MIGIVVYLVGAAGFLAVVEYTPAWAVSLIAVGFIAFCTAAFLLATRLQDETRRTRAEREKVYADAPFIPDTVAECLGHFYDREELWP